MPAAPKIFVSATSGDLGSIRRVVKDALLSIGCHPVDQSSFAPDYRSVRDMLAAKIGECQALIHIAGLRYGHEPDPATLPPGAPRRSYTQMEYHLGLELAAKRGSQRFRVYTFVCPENFPYDGTGEEEPSDKRALQAEHRRAIEQSDRLFTAVADLPDVEKRVREIQVKVEALEEESRSSTRRMLIASGIIAALLLVGIVALARLNRAVVERRPPGWSEELAALGVDPETIRAEDFHVEVTLGEANQVMYSVVTTDVLARALLKATPSVRLGDGSWRTTYNAGVEGQVAYGMYEPPLPAVGRVSIRFQPPFERTGTNRVIGPFDLSADVRQLLLEQFKKRALDARVWVESDHFNWAHADWRKFYPAVAKVRIGTQRDALPQVIPIDGVAFWTEHLHVGHFRMPRLDVDRKALALFVQLEFFDGTTSDVREVRRPVSPEATTPRARESPVSPEAARRAGEEMLAAAAKREGWKELVGQWRGRMQERSIGSVQLDVGGSEQAVQATFAAGNARPVALALKDVEPLFTTARYTFVSAQAGHEMALGSRRIRAIRIMPNMGRATIEFVNAEGDVIGACPVSRRVQF